MISKIAQLQQALASLKVAREPASPLKVAMRPATKTSAGSAPSRSDGPGVSLDDRIRQRVAALDKDDPQRRRRMLRVTLESCLVVEWGDNIANDPAFHALVDRVLDQIEGDPTLHALVDEALASLASPSLP